MDLCARLEHALLSSSILQLRSGHVVLDKKAALQICPPLLLEFAAADTVRTTCKRKFKHSTGDFIPLQMLFNVFAAVGVVLSAGSAVELEACSNDITQWSTSLTTMTRATRCQEHLPRCCQQHLPRWR